MFDDQNNNQQFPAGGGQPQPQNQPPVDLPQSSQPPVRPKNPGQVPGTEDIFADTDQAPEPTVMPQPQQATQPQMNQNQTQSDPGLQGPLSRLPDDLDEDRRGGSKKKFVIIGIIVLVVIVLGGIYFVYQNLFKGQLLPGGINVNNLNPQNINQQFEDNITNLNLNRNANTNQAFEETEEEPQCPEITPPSPDFCRDGKLQNSVDENGCPLPPTCLRDDSLDSDRDGLTDAEENELGTDSNSPDTDQDQLFDLEEVRVYQTDPLNPDSDGDGYNDGKEVRDGYDPLGPGRLDNFEEQI